MVAKVRYIGYMEDPHITTDDVTQQIWSAGPDGIKPDLLKILGNDTHCFNILTDTMNKIKQHTSILEYIKDRISTKKIKDLRPIVPTNATYKLFMGILKTKI